MIFHPRRWLEPHWLDALDVVRMEWVAVHGRWLAPKRIPTLGRDYLQLGSGESRITGFLNSCGFQNKSAEAKVDIRFPLRFPDNTWRGIYAHHVVEHISYPDAFQLFRGCHRTLKQGGVLRIVVPDLQTFINLYTANSAAERRKIFNLYPDETMETLNVKTPLEMMDYIFRDNKFNRHLSAWDWETAEFRLRDAGFSKVVRQIVNISLDPNLAGHDKPHWSAFSLYVEAIK